MDDIAAHTSPRIQLLSELADAMGMPVVAVVSGWFGDHVVNLDELAARAFIDVLDGELEHHDDTDHIGLFLLGRGGFPAFADGLWRALRGHGLASTAVVPYRIDGAHSLVALSAEERLFHPHGALGAYDRRPLGRVKARLDADVVFGLGEMPALGIDDPATIAEIAYERRQAQLAHHVMARMVGGTDSGVGARIERAMNARALGTELGLSAGELERLGLDCQTLADERAALVWQLFEAYEVELELLEPPTPRYTESDVANEVEFVPATGVTGALIEGAHQSLCYELDTGRPDPDTNMLDGEWLW